jgi:predicted Zn-ribbon and HTH transcriptional regulator
MIFLNFDNDYVDKTFEGTIFTDNTKHPQIIVNNNNSQKRYMKYIQLGHGKTFIVDTGINFTNFIKNEYPPAGDLRFGKNSKLEFTSNSNCKLNITYVTYDVLRYCKTLQQGVQVPYIYCMVQTPNEMITAINTTDSLPVTTSLLDLPPFLPLELLEPYKSPVQFNPYASLMEKYEKSQAIVDESEIDVCVVTYEAIIDYFYRCPKCKQVCSLSAMKEWIKINSSCPVCREEYTDYPQLYIKAKRGT